MSFRDYPFQDEYRSGEDDLISAFYHPALRAATQYWRAAGFFSSSVLEAIGAPLGEFVARGGQVRLVTSVHLEADDVAAITRGQDRKAVCEDRLLQQLESARETAH